MGENQDLCATFSCKKKKNNVIIPVASSVGALVVLLTAAAILMGLKQKKQHGITTFFSFLIKSFKFNRIIEFLIIHIRLWWY